MTAEAVPVLFGIGAFSTAFLIGAVQLFSPQSIAGWAVVVIGAIGTLYGARAYGRQRAGEVWRETSEGWQQRAELAARERDEQRALKHQARNELAAEKLKTDLTVVLTALQTILSTESRQTELLERLVERLAPSEPN
jgi:hypothetical protein